MNEKKLCDENPKYKKQRFYVSMSRLCKKSCLMCGDDGVYTLCVTELLGKAVGAVKGKGVGN